MEDKCCFPRCKNAPSIGYIGCDICNQHWGQLCESDGKTEKSLLKKIGLIRNKSSAVVPIE